MVKNNWKCSNFDSFYLLINCFDLLIDFFDLLIDLFIFNQKLDEFNIQIRWKLQFVDSKLSLESDSYHNHCLNLLESKFKSSTVRFGTPNRISLQWTSQGGSSRPNPLWDLHLTYKSLRLNCSSNLLVFQLSS